MKEEYTISAKTLELVLEALSAHRYSMYNDEEELNKDIDEADYLLREEMGVPL